MTETTSWGDLRPSSGCRRHDLAKKTTTCWWCCCWIVTLLTSSTTQGSVCLQNKTRSMLSLAPFKGARSSGAAVWVINERLWRKGNSISFKKLIFLYSGINNKINLWQWRTSEWVGNILHLMFVLWSFTGTKARVLRCVDTYAASCDEILGVSDSDSILLLVKTTSEVFQKPPAKWLQSHHFCQLHHAKTLL